MSSWYSFQAVTLLSLPRAKLSRLGPQLCPHCVSTWNASWKHLCTTLKENQKENGFTLASIPKWVLDTVWREWWGKVQKKAVRRADGCGGPGWRGHHRHQHLPSLPVGSLDGRGEIQSAQLKRVLTPPAPKVAAAPETALELKLSCSWDTWHFHFVVCVD